MRKVLVIAVHPDDETLGCGGTILKHKKDGDIVGCMFVTSGNDHQKTLINEVVNKYSFDFAESLNKPEITLDDLSLTELIPVFSEVINRFRPSILYVPNRSDTHSDHRKVFKAVSACIKSFRYPFIKRVLMCEIISETDFSPPLIENSFIPNVFVDITMFRDEKMNILNLYKNEILEDPHTRSLSAIEALQRYRGSQASVQYAEAFMLIKEIW
ncbi:MAG: PIG-L deacetylase family protein [Flavisolibacter sp.]